ncbi:MAG: spermidine synthase [Pseudomonadota bacterium]
MTDTTSNWPAKDGWFSEHCPMWAGMALSVAVDSLLVSLKSPFQQIDLYQTRTQGRMLVLDGIIQLTEADEFAYHEMLTHVPMFAHPNPETVLVIGGGDGGVLRELGRHDCVKTIDFCEIDAEVIRVARQFLPGTACGFEDPRVNIHIADGSRFVRERQGCYDVIIVDSSDPVGPGDTLFEKSFYLALKQALRPGGMVAAQGESFFMHPEWAGRMARITREVFDIQAYSYMLVPSYPGGNLGVCLGSLGPDPALPSRAVPVDFQEKLRYYTPDIHKASFVLPRFAGKIMGDL